MLFQMTFAIITPALIVGGFAERMKFSAMLLFSALWLLLVYVPVTHWVWGGGWLGEMGLYDFAGGTVVHITAGVAALVAALVLGPRRGFPTTAMPPHNMTMTVTGAGMLWVGWFGFNGGSALAADGDAGDGHAGHPHLRRGRCDDLDDRRNGCASASPAPWARSPAWSPVWAPSPRPPASSAPAARWSSASWPASSASSPPCSSSAC